MQPSICPTANYDSAFTFNGSSQDLGAAGLLGIASSTYTMAVE
jgi:hypothetical protein